jgi:plasmid stabilization system protein ParE
MNSAALAGGCGRGRARDGDLHPGLRSLPVGEYVIIYRIEDEHVQILRVLRGSRNIEALFGRWPLTKLTRRIIISLVNC